MYVCVCSVISALCYPMECSLVGSSAHEFSRQEYWSRLPLPTLRDLLIQGSNPCLLCLLNWQVSYLPLVPPGKPCIICMYPISLFFVFCFFLQLSLEQHRGWDVDPPHSQHSSHFSGPAAFGVLHLQIQSRIMQCYNIYYWKNSM